MRQQARNYIFRISFENGEVTELLPAEFPEWITYACWQLEIGDETAVLHYQGYMECLGKRSFVQIHQVPGFERAHLEQRHGTQQQAIDYATKADTRVDGPWFHGAQKEQGKRSDLHEIKELVDKGEPLVSIWDSHYGSMLRYHRAVKEYKRIKAPKRDWIPTIYILLGPSGVGKSRTARAMFPDAYWKPLNKWWDDYDMQEDIVWDEFSGQYPFRELLRVLDSTPLTVETKGGSVQFVGRNIIFTSNVAPADWYDAINIRQDWHTSPLKRRIDEFATIIQF